MKNFTDMKRKYFSVGQPSSVITNQYHPPYHHVLVLDQMEPIYIEENSVEERIRTNRKLFNMIAYIIKNVNTILQASNKYINYHPILLKWSFQTGIAASARVLVYLSVSFHWWKKLKSSVVDVNIVCIVLPVFQQRSHNISFDNKFTFLTFTTLSLCLGYALKSWYMFGGQIITKCIRCTLQCIGPECLGFK